MGKTSKWGCGCLGAVFYVVIILLMGNKLVGEENVEGFFIITSFVIAFSILLIAYLIYRRENKKTENLKEVEKQNIQNLLEKQSYKDGVKTYKFDFRDMVEGYDFVYQFQKYFNIKIEFDCYLEDYDVVYDAILNKIPLPVHFEIDISEWKEEKFDNLFDVFWKAEKATEGKFTYYNNYYDTIDDKEHEKEWWAEQNTMYDFFGHKITREY